MTLSPVLRTAALGLAAVALSAFAAHAAAPQVVSTSPSGKDGYGPWPKQIRMTFDQPLGQKGLQLDLLDPDGRRIPLAAPVRSGNAITVAPANRDYPVAGPYMLTWQGTSASGDAGRGDFTFFVR